MRRWFRREEAVRDSEKRIDRMLTSYQDQIADRLESGLQEIQDRTAALIRDVALEVWRSGEDDDLQERVLSVLSRDATIRGLISHTDERYQALDIRIGGLQDRLQSVTELADEVRGFVDRGLPDTSGDTWGDAAGEAGSIRLDDEGAELLRQRLASLQRYLAQVLDYEAERDHAISDWLLRMFSRGQDVLREEAGRVIGELRSEVEGESAISAERIIARLDEQTRRISYDLSLQEARVRLSVVEGAEDQASLLREQLEAIDSIEADLTSGLDQRLDRIVNLTGIAAAAAVDEAAERVGTRSVDAVNTGVKDLLALIDRRFAWLEETIQQRLERMERVLGAEPSQNQVIRLESELQPAPAGRSGSQT